MGYILTIAEKPSVARDIARVLGSARREDGYIDCGTVRVTWAIGHLVSLAEPEEVSERWKKWRMDDLPMLPEHIPLKVLPKTKKQYGIIRRLMMEKECDALICATDAGREGELIFRYIYRMANCGKPFQRLWISSMTDEAIREGFAALKPGAAYDGLYESARCRSEADWLVGMNASRAFTLRYGALLSVGRVQTPTLSLLVRRHQEIEAFESKPYWTLTADFGDYTGLWLHEETGEKRLYTQEAAEEIARKVRGMPAVVESVSREEKRERPPFLYDLTSLQRDANRLLGFTAKKTLTTAQQLYEEHKLLTYPRTDSRHLPRGMAGRVRSAVAALPEQYAAHAGPLLAQERPAMPTRIFDDTKVTDHHAIIPTGKKADLQRLPADAASLYDMVVRRLLAAFYPDHIYDGVRVRTRAQGETFESLGREIRQEGWKAVYADAPAGRRKGEEKTALPLPSLARGDARTVRKATVKTEKTKPPSPHTDASLLSAMEHAGREMEDELIRETMKDSGLGTPATRAAIIERLLQVGYAARKGRAIMATEKGVKLISVAPEEIVSPETTGRWEKALDDIAKGGMRSDRFMEGIRRMTAQIVQSARAGRSDVVFESEERQGRGRKKARGAPPQAGAACPVCQRGEVLENSKAFYCSRWKEGCTLTLWKNVAIRAGGPELTAALVRRLLAEGRLQGSTGTLVYERGNVSFAPRHGSPPEKS